MTRLMNQFFESTGAQTNNKKRQRPWNQRSFLNTPPLFQDLSTRPLNMIPMSSRRRAVVEFPLECALFVNKKAHLSITGINRYYIKSASATMMDTRTQDIGLKRISILFYDSSGTVVCASTIEIPKGWTPKLFLGLLLQECCLSNVISLFRILSNDQS